MANSINGTTATIGAWLLPLSSTLPPIVDRVAGRQLFGECRHLRLDSCCDDGRRLGRIKDTGLDA